MSRIVVVGLTFAATVCVVPAFELTPAKSHVTQRSAASAPRLTRHHRPQVPLMTSASLEASAPPPSSGAGVGPSIVNLAKNIVGSGVLALAAGVAAFSGANVALIPSLILLLVVGMVSAYSFSSIARVGAAVGASSYRETWSKIFGERTA